MENKGIWDLIAKIASPLTGENNQKTTNEANQNNNETILTEKEKAVAQPLSEKSNNPFCESFAKSYNPFSSLPFNRGQITSKKAQKPLKCTIDLNSSKPVKMQKTVEKSHDIIQLINNHNRHVKLVNENLKKN